MQFPKKSHYTTDEMYKMANEMRLDLIKMLTLAGSGHSASPLATMEMWTAFYFHILNHNPKDPAWEERDRLLLSCGHYCPARYTAMAHAGYFPQGPELFVREIASVGHCRVAGGTVVAAGKEQPVAFFPVRFLRVVVQDVEIH